MHEVEGREKPNGARGKQDGNHHEERVSHVQNRGHRSAQAVQIEDKVIDRVQEHVESNGPGSEERLPPPPMILNT